jgi:hypothetical protein
MMRDRVDLPRLNSKWLVLSYFHEHDVLETYAAISAKSGAIYGMGYARV